MADTQTATFLFTDLVGSTALSTSMSPAEADDVRREHFQLLRAPIETTGGVEVKNLGDGLMVVFTSASRALACATAMQQAVERGNRRNERSLGLRVGVAMGEATEEDGDYFGDAVVEAARLCAAASGGQILSTEALKAIVGRHASQTMRSIGALELKGLPEPVAVVELLWEPDADEVVPLPARLVGGSREATFGFVGRSSEQASLAQALKEAMSSAELRVALIGGEPGIGKSALAARAARSAHESGVVVSFGACEEGLGIAFHAWLGALAHLIEHDPGDTIATMRPSHVSAIRRLLPHLADQLSAADESGTDLEAERYLLLDAVAALLAGASRSHGLVVMLDDLQWADVASLQLLTHLTRSAVAARALIIGTFRPGDLGIGHPLAGLLADLRAEAGVQRLDLQGLADDEVVDLLETAAGQQLDTSGADLAHAVRRETAGNPFFLVEMLRHLGESGSIVQDSRGRYSLSSDLAELALPASVREVVGRRVRRLGDEALSVLSSASVIGSEFDLDVLAAITDQGEDRLLDLLDATVSAALVVELDDPPGRYRFAHALVQSTLYAELSPARRQRAHQRVAAFLEERNLAGDANAVAHHFLAAVRPADVEKAIEYALRAGDAAMAALAPLDAVNWYRRGLDALERSSTVDIRRRAELLVSIAEAEVIAGDGTYRDTLLEAATAAFDCDDTSLIVRAALVRVPGSINSTADPDPRQVEFLERALDRIGSTDSAPRARLLAALTDEFGQGHPVEAARYATEAWEIADRLDDADTLLNVFLLCSFALRGVHHREQSRAWLERVTPLLAANRDRSIQFWAMNAKIIEAAEELDWPRIDALVSELAERAEDVGLDLYRWEPTMIRAWTALTRGRLDEGDRLAGAALEVGLSAGISPATTSYGAQLMMHRLFSGNLEQILEQAGLAEPPLEAVAVGWRLAVVWVNLQVGRIDRARELFTQREQGVDLIPLDSVWAQTVCLLGDSSIALDRLDLVQECYELIRPHAREFFFSGSHDIGYLARYAGRMAAAIGRIDEAEEHLRYSLHMHQEKGLPYFEMRSALDLARVIRDRRPEEAEELEASARDLAARFGFGGTAVYSA